MAKNRVYNQLPKVFQNDFNRKQLSVTEDTIFEPENFSLVEGQIGDEGIVSEREEKRTPFLKQHPSSNPKTQLSPAAVYTDDSGNIIKGVFYDDLIGHISSNGGIVDDQSKLFECDYYSFNPPINIDMWTNFQKYFWTGFGTSRAFGEYVTKDYEGSQTVLYQTNNDGTLTKKNVTLHSGSLPVSSTVGNLIEHVSSTNRPIYVWNGSTWVLVKFDALDSLPASYTPGKYVYVTRIGPNFQRHVFQHFSETAGRYISKLAIISKLEPDSPVEGMIWERITGNNRIFNVYKNGQWTELDYDVNSNFVSVNRNDSGYYHDIRALSSVADDWSKTNWWVHINDLSSYDRSVLKEEGAIRPILSFWQSIEAFSNNKPVSNSGALIRNSSPLFNVYMYNGETITDSIDNFFGNTILDFDDTQRKFDSVLERYVSYDTTGEILYTLTLETENYTSNDEPLSGYKFFKDTYTGKFHYVWTKSPTKLIFDPEQQQVPLNLSSNANHEIKTTLSRRDVLNHYKSIIENNATGLPLGDNSYRWTDRNPVNGAVIIDTEGSLLLNLVSLMDEKFDPANAIRSMASEYSKFMKRFHKKLTALWTDPSVVNPDGTLKTLTTDQALNKVLSQIFVYIDSSRPFFNAGMGTFLHDTYQKQVPIMIPASAARIGAIAPFSPRVVKYFENEHYILGHDGSLYPTYGDQRDQVVLALENKFFDVLPSNRKQETAEASPLLNKNYFEIKRYVDNLVLIEDYDAVDEIVLDYTVIASPTNGLRVYSQKHGKIATYINASWSTVDIIIGSIFKNNDDGEYYIFDGFNTSVISTFNKSFEYDYNVNDFMSVIRKEYEKWYIERGLNPSSNDLFDENNKFTWNYKSSGLEGYWRGLYKRIYGTDRPHLAPWEILGFSLKPEWWGNIYSADDTIDGVDVWYNTNDMWEDLKTGELIVGEGIVLENWQLLHEDAPIPVDEDGALLDPASLNFATLDQLRERAESWSYGDGSPVETTYLTSYEGRFAYALAAYLMKPARFVEFLWSDYNFSIGNSTTLFGGEVQVSANTYKRRSVSAIKIHAATKGYTDMGLNSWLAEYLLISGNSPILLADIVKNSQVSLGWQVNGYIRKNSTILRTSSGVIIPYEDTHVVLNKSQPIKTIFYSGVNILKTNDGYKLYGYDQSRPVFNTLEHISSTIGGRSSLEQNYTASEGQRVFNLTEFRINNVNDLSKLTILVDGLKIDDWNYKIVNSTTIELVDLTLREGQAVSLVLNTFISALPYAAKTLTVGETRYLYFDKSSNRVISYDYGHEFKNPTDIIQFFSNYQNYLRREGFVLDNNEWMGVAARFISWASTATVNQIFVDVALPNEIKMKFDFGFVENVKLNQYGGYNVLDIAGRPIDDFNSFRFENEYSIKSQSPIYGLRVVLKTYQHAVFFSNRTKFSDLIYDSFSGLRQKRLLVSTHKSNEWSGTLNVPGYILNGNELVPNLEKVTKDLSRSYDSTTTLNESSKLVENMALYNFFDKEYMRSLGVSNIMAFDYHKRMIREKGTKKALLAFSKATANTTGVEIRECWAWKLGDFGQSRLDRAEILIKETDFVKKLQTFVFSNTKQVESDVLIENYSTNASRWVVKPNGDNISFNNYNENVLNISLYENGILKNKVFNYNPLLGFYEPHASSQIDIKTAYDPAYYSVGTKVFPGFAWGPEQVGTIWWDTSREVYENYLNNDLTLDESTERWGKLKSETIISISNFGDEYTATFETDHEFEVDDIVTIRLNDNSRVYNAIIKYVTNSKTVVFTLITDSLDVVTVDFDNEYLKFKFMSKYDIAVYEWIETTDEPLDYLEKNPELRVKFGEELSYSVFYKEQVPYYYFWVRNKKTVSSRKTLSVIDIEMRLKNPSVSLVPWFGVYNDNSLVMDTTSIGNKTGLTLEVSLEPIDFEENNQWKILIENDTTNLIDDVVISKLIDSLTLVDEYGNELPYVQFDEMGSQHGQIVYSDMAKAKAVLLNSLNSVFKKIYRYNIVDFTQAFPSDGNWWSYTDYDTIEFTPSQYVQTKNELNSIQDIKNGDYIEVKQARLESGQYKSEVYQKDNTDWVLVKSEGTAVEFNENFVDVMRKYFKTILNSISVTDANEIIWTLLYEMMVQNPQCSWMFKTSYIDVKNNVDNTTYSVNPPNETNAIAENINDVKPFNTKIRDLITTHNIYSDNFEYDTASVSIEEEYAKKITLFVDRLSCNLFEDSTSDFDPTDTVPADMPFWTRDNVATEDWRTVTTFTSSNTNTYRLISSRRFLNYKINTYNSSNNLVNTPVYSLSFDRNDVITVKFTAIPPSGHTFVLQASTGTVSDSILTLNPIGSEFTEIKSTYEHAAAVVRSKVSGVHNNRTITQSSANEFTGCSNTDVMDGGNSEERLRNDIVDKLTIKVTTEFTPAYSSADGAPADIIPCDVTLGQMSDVSFYMVYNDQRDEEILSETVPTTETVEIDGTNKNNRIFFTSNPRYRITAVKIVRDGVPSMLNSDDYYNINKSSVYINAPLLEDDELVLYIGEFVLLSNKLTISPSWTKNYQINGNILTYDNPAPTSGNSLSIEYSNDTIYELSGGSSVIAKPYFVVNDKVSSSDVIYSLADTNYIIIDEEDGLVKQFNGTTYDTIQRVSNVPYYVEQEQKTYIFNGSEWIEDFVAGDSVLAYKYGGFGSGTSLNYVSFVNEELIDSERYARVEFQDDADVIARWSNTSLVLFDEDDNVDHWHDVSINNFILGNTNTSKRPSWSVDSNNLYNGVEFSGSEYLSLDHEEDISELFNGGGYLSLVLTITGAGQSTINKIVGNGSYKLEQTTGASGSDYRLIFTHSFDNTNGSWTYNSPTNFLFDNTITVEISYDSGNVNNNPVFKVNGATLSVSSEIEPVGTTQEGTLPLIIGANFTDIDEFDTLLRFDSSSYKVNGDVVDFGDITDFHVTRNSVGSAKTSQGNIVVFGNDEPRITDLGLFVEPASTNVSHYSQDLSNAYWTKQSVTVSSDTSVAPDGTTTADSIFETAVSSSHRIQRNYSVVSGTTYTISAFIKPINRRYIVFRMALRDTVTLENVSIDTQTDSVTAHTANYTVSFEKFGDYYRVSATTQCISSGTGSLYIGPSITAPNTGSPSYLGETNAGFVIWGIQLEESSIATSYIPTTTASVTRAADVIRLDSVETESENVLYVEHSLYRSNVTARLIQLDDGDDENVVGIYIKNDNTHAAYVVNANTIQTDSGISGFQPNTTYRALSNYVTDNVYLAVNGTRSGTDTVSTVPTGLTTFRIGSTAAGTEQASGFIKAVGIIKTTLTKSELGHITTGTSSISGVVHEILFSNSSPTNYFSKVLAKKYE